MYRSKIFKRISCKIISIVLAFSFLIFSSNVYAAPNLVGGITINNGDEKTTKQDVDLTITAGEPTSTSKLETSQADFKQGTLTKVVTSGDNIKLDKFIDGGFEDGNFDTWDGSSFSIVTNPVASGKYAAMAKGTARGLSKRFSQPQKSLYVKCKVLFTETNQHHYAISFGTERSSFHALTAAPNGYFGGCHYEPFPINTPYTANKWYTVECYWFGDSGTYKLIIDGVDVTKGGIGANDWYGNPANTVYGFSCTNTNGDGGSGGMAIDDVYITNNLPPVLDDGFESGNFNK